MWLVKTWKIWRLRRKWYEIYFKGSSGTHCIKLVCFGTMLQRVGDGCTCRIFRVNDDGEWGRLIEGKDHDCGAISLHGSSSSATERKYQEYLSELAELTLL